MWLTQQSVGMFPGSSITGENEFLCLLLTSVEFVLLHYVLSGQVVIL